MSADLSAYLTRATTLPWVWGRSDCTIWVADWCLLRFGFDPAAGFRGRYDDRAGAERLIAAGLARTIAPCMTPLRETREPHPGDVGIIEIGGRQVAAIRTGPRWAFRTLRGLGEAPASPVISWGEPCRKPFRS